jgi:GT2 family glycosyltransferase
MAIDKEWQAQLLANQAELNRRQSELQKNQAKLEYQYFKPVVPVPKKSGNAINFVSKFFSILQEEGLIKLLVKIVKKIQSRFNLAHFQAQELIEQKIADPKWQESIQLSQPYSLELATSNEPVISIIIPVYNQSVYTFKCLSSLANINDNLKFEVLVIDDCSTDDTQEILAQIKGIRAVKNRHNSGFIESCNRCASLAKGEYLVFLNNDTVPQTNCFDELLETLKLHPDAGLVGAKLLYPDGKLQEAGGIIWNDASGWNYGRLDDPNKPEYCYLREVDYCSGACIMVPKVLFEKLGGFDTRYKPAYAEDADLAFQIRQAGYKVFYQPLAEVIHFEGITSGTDLTTGVKQYQVINQQKFLQKWNDILNNYGTSGENPDFAKERQVKKRILVVDACTLTPDQDAGSLTALNYIKIFQSLGYKVTFVADNLLYVEKYTQNLQRIGVECLYAPYLTSLKSHLQKCGDYYDIVYLTRIEIADRHIDDVKTYCCRAKIIFDPVDLHHIREQRQAEVENDPILARRAMQTKAKELAVAAKADCTLVLSDVEKNVLLQENSQLKIAVFPVARDIYGASRKFVERKDILFIGGFQHLPNIDAVIFFTKEILPLIQAQIKDIKFFIIGSKPTQEVLSLASTNVIVTGYVEDISGYFNQCRLSVVPLRYGAGVKGKIVTSLSYGLPCVGTSLACEGMGLQHNLDVLIADTPEDFAQNVVKLYYDENLWYRLSQNGIKAVLKNYSIDKTLHLFQNLFQDLTANHQ